MQTDIKDYNAKIEKNYRWNFFWMTLDNMMFFFIFMGLSPYTILPFYVEHFTDSKILIGLIPTVYLVGTTLPQLFMANFLRKRRRRKKYLVLAASIQRFGILGLLLLSIIEPRLNLSPALTLTLFFLMLALQHGASGFYVPAWLDFLGKSIPRKRGLLFGISNLAGGLMGLGLGWLLSYLLEAYPFEQAIPVIFGISFGASLVSLVGILSWREVVPPESFFEGEDDHENTFAGVLKDKNFVQYLIWRGLMVVLEIATPFYSISALEQLNAGAAQIGVFTTILSFSQAVINPFWGWLGDRKGFLWVVKLSALTGSLAALIAIFAPSLISYYVIFLFIGAMISGFSISSLNIVFEFSPKQVVPLYTAITQISLTPLSSVIPLLGGVIAERSGFVTNYWLAGGLGLLSLIGISISVKNPKKQPPKAALEKNPAANENS
jgi:MFS family permease